LQIEEVIRQWPGVADLGVFALKDKDDQELLAALVVKKKGETLDVSGLFEHLRKNLEPFKLLRGGLFIGEARDLPKNAQGKLQRKKLAEKFAQ